MKNNTAMLWFDNDSKKSLAEKIDGAVSYYEAKYGEHPNCCFVHPNMSVTGSVDGIEIKTSRSVLPNHLWIGVE